MSEDFERSPRFAASAAPLSAASLILQAYQKFVCLTLEWIDPLQRLRSELTDAPSPQKVNRRTSQHDQNSNSGSSGREKCQAAQRSDRRHFTVDQRAARLICAVRSDVELITTLEWISPVH
ncbi:MAG: hypothetical protein DME49_05355 [Verrucomicrobia bacterium]|nr:MAG: hypothetical protein DME49_05355 [Verrucomicrobiota bacterium]